ncbi:hypothetical protein Ssi03_61390 [Sphaerisporangium siamense]|nr:hypothetical protein Ssi03_61390 [Sphaerisporangium siamense]
MVTAATATGVPADRRALPILVAIAVNGLGALTGATVLALSTRRLV